MNAKAAKACRAWLAAGNFDLHARSRAYRHAKSAFKTLSHRERGALREQWEEARTLRRSRGEVKAQNKSAIISAKDLKL